MRAECRNASSTCGARYTRWCTRRAGELVACSAVLKLACVTLAGAFTADEGALLGSKPRHQGACRNNARERDGVRERLSLAGSEHTYQRRKEGGASSGTRVEVHGHQELERTLVADRHDGIERAGLRVNYICAQRLTRLSKHASKRESATAYGVGAHVPALPPPSSMYQPPEMLAYVVSVMFCDVKLTSVRCVVVRPVTCRPTPTTLLVLESQSMVSIMPVSVTLYSWPVLTLTPRIMIELLMPMLIHWMLVLGSKAFGPPSTSMKPCRRVVVGTPHRRRSHASERTNEPC